MLRVFVEEVLGRAPAHTRNASTHIRTQKAKLREKGSVEHYHKCKRLKSPFGLGPHPPPPRPLQALSDKQKGMSPTRSLARSKCKRKRPATCACVCACTWERYYHNKTTLYICRQCYIHASNGYFVPLHTHTRTCSPLSLHTEEKFQWQPFHKAFFTASKNAKDLSSLFRRKEFESAQKSRNEPQHQNASRHNAELPQTE